MRKSDVLGRSFVFGSLVAATILASVHCGSGSSSTGTGGGGGFVSIGIGPSTSATTTSGGGATTTSTGTATTSSSGTGGSSQSGASVLQYHTQPTRVGTTIDPNLTQAAAAKMHLDGGFQAQIDGAAYAQPLFLDTGGGKDLLFVATEKNQVYALDAVNGSVVWNHKLGPEVDVAKLGCGNINPYGVTGTPIIDLPSRTMFLDAIVDGPNGPGHQVFALSIDDGTTKAGWPVDADAKFSFNGYMFNSKVTGERGALAILGDTLYVPYGGLWGDCGDYRGWVVGLKMSDPTKITTWATGDRGGGIWAPSGLAVLGNKIFGVTGNTFTGSMWNGGEATIAFDPGPSFSNNNASYWVPTNWKALDDSDIDMSGTGPILFDVQGATPSELAIALGKDSNMYLMDATNLGGITDAIATKKVANKEIIGSATAYLTASGRYVAFKGQCTQGNGNLVGVKIGASAPPTIEIAWCADQGGSGTPISTTTDGSSDPIVWAVGAEGDNRLHGFDGGTGAVVFDGGGQNDAMNGIARFATPITAKGRIYVAGQDQVYSFTSQ